MTYFAKQRRVVRSITALAALSLVPAVNGCGNIDVENLNGASVDALETNPTPTSIIAASQALMSTWRGTSGGHANSLSRYGYELWDIRTSNPPSLTSVVLFPETGGFWGYGGVRNIQAILRALNTVVGMSDADKEGIKGWAKLNMAVQLEDMAQAHDTFGIVLDLPADPLIDIPPIEPKAAVWARIFTLLDEADAHLAAAGTAAFAFRLGPGYAGFNTPATFRQVGRALKARYQVLSNDWSGALTSLGASFINSGAAGLTRTGLLRGPFHTYTTNTGDGTNGLSGTSYYLNMRIRDDAQLKAVAGARDDRVGLKIRPVTAFSFLNVTSDIRRADYYNTSPTSATALATTSSLPIIRNEELILLRAEANLGLGNTDAAIDDINLIRVNSGGLPPYPKPYVVTPGLGQPATLLDALLYEKRYSLWMEIGTVWLDMRHYGKILEIPRYRPEFKLKEIFPIPQAECEIRGYQTRGCFASGYPGL